MDSHKGSRSASISFDDSKESDDFTNFPLLRKVTNPFLKKRMHNKRGPARFDSSSIEIEDLTESAFSHVQEESLSLEESSVESIVSPKLGSSKILTQRTKDSVASFVRHKLS